MDSKISSLALSVTILLLMSISVSAAPSLVDKGGTLRYSSTKLIKALEPVTSNSIATLRMTSLLFEGLVQRDEFGTGVMPLLAESFDGSPDVITFNLKKDVKWHDGYPFTAHDVAFTFRLIRNPKTETALRDEFDFISDVNVVSDHKVVFTFKRPVYKAERRFLALKILPRHRFSVVSDDSKPASVGKQVQLGYADVPLLSSPQPNSRVVKELPNKVWVSIQGERSNYYQVQVVRSGPVGSTGWIPKYKTFLSREQGSFVLNPVGTGPYKFDTINISRGINLERNDKYHSDAPNIEFVRRTRTSDKNTMVNLLLQEILNLLPETPLEDVSRIEKSGVADTVEYASLKFSGFAYNCARAPLSESKVRRAMTMALDRTQLLDTFYQGKGQVIAGPFSPQSWGVDLNLQPLPHDLEQAGKLLDEAVGSKPSTGLRKTKDGSPMTFSLIISNEQNPADYNMAHAYKDAMSKLGIEVSVEVVDKGRFTQQLQERDYDIAYLEWNFGYSYNIKPLFHPEGALNYTNYKNDEVRDIIDVMSGQNDPEAIRELVYQLQEVIAEDAPYTFLWTLKNVASVNLNLQGVSPDTIDPYEFFTWIEEWWIPREAQ